MWRTRNLYRSDERFAATDDEPRLGLRNAVDSGTVAVNTHRLGRPIG